MKRLVINILFFAILLTLIAGTVFGKRGFIHLMNIEKEFRQMESNNEQLKMENEKLKFEIHNLKNSIRYLEELSRNELGFAKKGELIYRAEKKKK